MLHQQRVGPVGAQDPTGGTHVSSLDRCIARQAPKKFVAQRIGAGNSFNFGNDGRPLTGHIDGGMRKTHEGSTPVAENRDMSEPYSWASRRRLSRRIRHP